MNIDLPQILAGGKTAPLLPAGLQGFLIAVLQVQLADLQPADLLGLAADPGSLPGQQAVDGLKLTGFAQVAEDLIQLVALNHGFLVKTGYLIISSLAPGMKRMLAHQGQGEILQIIVLPQGVGDDDQLAVDIALVESPVAQQTLIVDFGFAPVALLKIQFRQQRIGGNVQGALRINAPKFPERDDGTEGIAQGQAGTEHEKVAIIFYPLNPRCIAEETGNSIFIVTEPVKAVGGLEVNLGIADDKGFLGAQGIAKIFQRPGVVFLFIIAGSPEIIAGVCRCRLRP